MDSGSGILLIDDSPHERLVILEALRQEFPGRSIISVVTEKDFQRALDSGGIALVVADYYLGWASGVDLVRSVKNRYGDCPGVMFAGTDPVRSGTLADSVELAEAFQRTLNSVGYRDSIAYLVAAVRHGLEMAAKSREMQDVQNRYRELFNHVQLAFIAALRTAGSWTPIRRWSRCWVTPAVKS
jgi:DNA-binding NtrC family response regulator